MCPSHFSMGCFTWPAWIFNKAADITLLKQWWHLPHSISQERSYPTSKRRTDDSTTTLICSEYEHKNTVWTSIQERKNTISILFWTIPTLFLESYSYRLCSHISRSINLKNISQSYYFDLYLCKGCIDNNMGPRPVLNRDIIESASDIIIQTQKILITHHSHYKSQSHYNNCYMIHWCLSTQRNFRCCSNDKYRLCVNTGVVLSSKQPFWAHTVRER